MGKEEIELLDEVVPSKKVSKIENKTPKKNDKNSEKRDKYSEKKDKTPEEKKNKFEEKGKSYNKSKKKKKQEKEQMSKEERKKILLYNIKVVSIKIVFIITLVYVMFFQIFGLTRINNLSMHPTIASGDLLIYYRLDKEYNVGDVVTFEKNGKRYVLRILAVENQTVNLTSNNELINASISLEKETLFKDVIPNNSKVKYPYKVGKGKVFVVGDYRLETDDSREFGAIDTSIIDGKVISLVQTKDI